MHNGDSIAISLVILALLVRRQLRVRPVRESTSFVLLGVLCVLGVAAFAVGVKSVTKYHPLSASTVVLICASFVLAAVFGVLRALTVRVWRDAAGVAMRQGTAVTMVLWAVSIAVHYGMDAWIDHSTKVGALGFSTVYLYLAVTFGVQSFVIRRRAAAMVATAAPVQGLADPS